MFDHAVKSNNKNMVLTMIEHMHVKLDADTCLRICARYDSAWGFLKMRNSLCDANDVFATLVKHEAHECLEQAMRLHNINTDWDFSEVDSAYGEDPVGKQQATAEVVCGLSVFDSENADLFEALIGTFIIPNDVLEHLTHATLTGLVDMWNLHCSYDHINASFFETAIKFQSLERQKRTLAKRQEEMLTQDEDKNDLM